nr:reverse transcriptase domain-containing protein [Tanacetum cinerariifolium]
MEERLVNGWMIIQREFDELKIELEKVPQEAQAVNMAYTDNTNRNLEQAPVARKCSYKEFRSCQSFNFNGSEGAVGLICRFERTELVFSRSNCTEDCKVKFATGTLTEDALSRWNSYAKPTGIEQADKIAWIELKRLLTNKYCPRTEVEKIEDEFYNLVVKGNDLKTYIRRFQELALLCPNMVSNFEKLMEVFIKGLPRSIEGNVTASKPQTLEESITITQRLMEQVIKHNFAQETNDHKQKFEDGRNTTTNNKNNHPNDRNNNNHSNNRNSNNYQNNPREAQAANMDNTDNTNRNPEQAHVARKCSYKEFISCQPFNFKGSEGAVGLIRWFEHTESVFSRSNCTEDWKVKFSTLTEDALSWWNSYAKPIGIEQADKIAWTELKRLLTNKYCPRTEVKKMEDKFYNLVVKGNDLKTYIRRKCYHFKTLNLRRSHYYNPEIDGAIMSSPNHPTSDIKDAFSSNSLDYVLASPDYFPTSPRNTSSDSLVNPSGLIPIASPTLSLFHDDPYMKVMHAYYAEELPIPTLITSSIVLYLSPVLPLPLFNPQDFFVLEVLLSPKKQVCFLSSSSTDSSDLPQNQAYNLALTSFSVYITNPPQIFKIGKSSIKMHLKHHRRYFELFRGTFFYRIEKMKERLVNGWMIIQRDFDELKIELEEVCSQISELQKKHLGQKDKIAFARFRISNLEQALKDIQARHQIMKNLLGHIS